MLWRNLESTKVYQLCNPIDIAEGILISHDFDQTVRYILRGSYQQQCYEGATPMLNSNVKLILNRFLQPLPIVRQEWQEFSKNPNGGTFIYSVIPVIYSISILSVITWFLTIFIMTNYTVKPSPLLRATATASSAYMLMTVIKSIVVLHEQQKHGYLHGMSLLDHLNNLVFLNVIDLIVTFFLQINQVQVVMRLFLRQSDKRMVFLVGFLGSICSQTIWGVMKFHKFPPNDELDKILPALVYLTRIAMGISYAAIFTAFMLTKLKTLMLHKNIWAISLLTVVLIYAPVSFFIADVSSTWIYEMSDVFSVATYVVCVILPWEWCNQYNMIRKQLEKEGVLGRKFYEDELYELDKFELFVEEDSDAASDPGDEDGAITSRSIILSLSSMHSGLRNANRKPDQRPTLAFLADGANVVKDTFVSITDKIIATGLAIPRSLSTGSSAGTLPNTHLEMRSPNTDGPMRRSAIGPARPRNHGPRGDSAVRTHNNVYIYSTKDVVIDVD